MIRFIISMILVILCQTVFSQIGSVIKDVNYFDVNDATFKTANVLIIDDKIAKVSKKGKLDKSFLEIDGKGKYLIPGLFDTHIHFFQSGGIYARPDAVDLREHRPYDDEREWVFNQTGKFLDRYLACGITSVVDVGGPMKNYNLRDAHKSPKRNPNIFITGPLISTYQPEAWNIDDSPIIKCSNKEEAIELVRKQAKYKPDFIKIWYIALPTQTAESNFEIVEAAARESHNLGLPVAIHATQLNTAKLAVKAGADILVHSVDDKLVDEDFINMLLENKTVYVPSMIVSGNYSKTFLAMTSPSMEDHLYAHPQTLGQLYEVKNQAIDSIFKGYEQYKSSMLERNSKRDSIMAYNVKALADAGVIIATGTDAGNIGTLHASSYFTELRTMKAAGLSNEQILLFSTINGAKAVGMSKSLGSIEQGKIADLVLLNSNPLDDLNALKDIKYIIKGGQAYKKETLLSYSPEDLVQMQLNGYNARNIEAFLYPYAEDLKIYNFPDELTGEGIENIRPRYENMFEKYPDLYCELVNRIVLGNTVIDQERVTITKEKTINAIAIYKIRDGKIAEVYFVND